MYAYQFGRNIFIYKFIYRLIVVPMGKVIMVSDEVYERLKMLKKPGESFSDVILRLLSYKPKLSDLIGRRTITISEWNKVKKELKIREELDEIRRSYLLGLMER